MKIVETIKYIKENKKKIYYPYYGMEIFLGDFGQGKTISAVKIIKERLEKYPEVTLITNVEIKGIKKVIYFRNTEELIEILSNKIQLNSNGYIIFIDECHVVFAELFGRTDPIFLTFLSQQRKLSINIIGTCQLFSKLPKFIREYELQGGQIYICKKYFKILQIIKHVDMNEVKEDSKNKLVYNKCKIEAYIHTKELYESYDTFAVISQIQGLMKGSLKYDRLPNDN